jgi:hypothetical protein
VPALTKDRDTSKVSLRPLIVSAEPASLFQLPLLTFAVSCLPVRLKAPPLALARLKMPNFPFHQDACLPWFYLERVDKSS